MKILAAFTALLISSSALANSFDQFIGEYTVTGSVEIKNTNAQFCNRFGISKLNGLRVEANTQGYEQSHVIYFDKPTGWSGHPVSEYRYKNEYYPVTGSFSSVTGGAGNASVSNGHFGTFSEDIFTVSLTAKAQGVELLVKDQVLENGNVARACEYKAQLTKK